MRLPAAALAALLILATPSLAGPDDCPAGVADVTGTNPSYAETAALLEAAAAKHDVPPQVLKAIAYREGFNDAGRRWSQFHSTGAVVISAADDACGVGIMQVTATGRADAVQLASDVAYNVDEGAEILAAKYAESQGDDPDDRYLVENWYYAVCAYNGCTGTSTVYTDAIALAVADPFQHMQPVRSWAAPLGYTRPQDADPSYAFPAGFEAQREPSVFVFDGPPPKTVAAPTHDWRTPPPVVYPAGSIGPDADGVTCFECQWWRLAAGLGVAGRARWTKSNGPALGTSITWAPALPRSGPYRVAAYIPTGEEQGHATYAVGGITVAVDQAAQTGWVDLGQRTLGPGSTVVLTDQGDPPGATRLYADAMRFAAVPALGLAVSAPAVTYGQPVTLTATLTHGGAALGGRPVRLYRRRVGTTPWTLLGVWTTGPDGRVRVGARPVENTQYTARFVPPAADVVAAASADRRVDVRTAVRAALNRTSMPAGGTSTISTTVAPRHAGQQVQLQRYTGGAWRTVLARTLSSTSGAAFTFRLTGRGVYYFRVYKPADADHAWAVTGTLTLRVT